MGDPIDVEELFAEEEEVGFVQYYTNAGLGLISAYGWYIFAASIAIYFLWKNYGDRMFPERTNRRPERDVGAPSPNRNEARQKYVAKLQEQYEKEAAARAEKLKAKEEEKRQRRIEELEKLAGRRKSDGQKLGTKSGTSGSQNGSSKSKSLRPEYNPLMGDTSTYSRPCNRSSDRSGG